MAYPTSSPYFLGYEYDTENLITTVQLSGDNYHEWAQTMRLSLRALRKYGFVDGTILKPTQASMVQDWKTVHKTIVLWIMYTIEPCLRSTIPYYEDASLLWKYLKDRFSVADGLRIQQLMTCLRDCKQDKNEAIFHYYGRLNKLWNDLDYYEPLPECKCGGCSCGLGAKIARQQEVNRLYKFLMGLDHIKYGAVRSTLLCMDPLPTLNRAYQIVLQEERLKDCQTSRCKNIRMN